MSPPLSRWSTLIALLAGAALSGCVFLPKTVMPKTDYPPESFTSSNVYTHTFPGTDQATCEAARRALLSQGYVISEASPSLVMGRKNFQPDSAIHMQIAFHVVCAPDGKGSNSTTVFANAVRDRYSLKKSNNSASLGVGGVGSVSLPIGMSDDSLVKVASETIASKDFYEGYFSVVERYLDIPAEILSIETRAGSAPALPPNE